MPSSRHAHRIMAVLAHPDDESLGFGGTLARYAAEGHGTYLVTATRGQAGRHGGEGPHPGPEALGRIREAELRAAAEVLGVDEVTVLDHMDARLDAADPARVVGEVADEIRRVRPDVVLTFPPDGGYGHPDHIAISQFATAAVVAAAAGGTEGGAGGPAWGRAGGPVGDPAAGGASATRPHAVSKLYYLAWGPDTWAAYQAAFKELTSTVDGVRRKAAPWPEWAITTRIDTTDHWPTVWEAVRCHATQLPGYAGLAHLSEEHHRGLWGQQTFYRVFSTVNGGRTPETDLLEGLTREMAS